MRSGWQVAEGYPDEGSIDQKRMNEVLFQTIFLFAIDSFQSFFALSFEFFSANLSDSLDLNDSYLRYRRSEAIAIFLLSHVFVDSNFRFRFSAIRKIF